MHCPQCGQHVITDDAHFCKQCGLAFGAVRDLLARSASTPISPPSLLYIPVGGDARSLKGVTQAVYLLMIAFMPFLLAAAQGLLGFALVPAMLLMKVFFALLCLPVLRFGYALYEARQEQRPGSKTQSGIEVHRPEAFPTQGKLAGAFDDRRIDTAEIVPPPSVTESTTKLLGRQRDRQ